MSASLTPLQRDVVGIYLRQRGRRGWATIAGDTLGISPNAARVNLARVKQRLGKDPMEEPTLASPSELQLLTDAESYLQKAMVLLLQGKDPRIYDWVQDLCVIASAVKGQREKLEISRDVGNGPS